MIFILIVVYVDGYIRATKFRRKVVSLFTENVRHSRGECKKPQVVELSVDQRRHEEFVKLQTKMMDLHQALVLEMTSVPPHILARQLAQNEE